MDDNLNSRKLKFCDLLYKEITNKIPLVVAINNLELASAEFIYSIFYLIKRVKVRREQILFILSLDSTDDEKKAIELQNIIENEPDSVTIAITPLSIEEMIKLFSASFSRGIDKELINYLFSITQGKRSETEELINLLIKKRQIVYKPSQKKITLSDTFKSDCNFDITKIESLDEKSSKILNIISSYSKPIGINLLKSIILRLESAPAIPQYLATIKQLIEREILSSTTEQANNYISFSSTILLKEYYNKIPDDGKIVIHNSIALELEETALENERIMDEVVNHLYSARNSKKAFNYSINLARVAEGRGLLSDSLTYLEKTYKFYDWLNEDDRIELLFMRGKILSMLYKFDEAFINFKILSEINLKTRDEINLHLLKAKAYSSMGRVDESLKEIDEGLLFAAKRPLSYLTLELLFLKSTLLIRTSHYDLAINIINQSIADSMDKEFKLYKLKFLNTLSLACYYKGNYGEALKILEQNIIASTDVKDSFFHIQASNTMGMIHYQEGRFVEALAAYKNVLELSKDNPLSFEFAMATQNIAAIYHKIGSFSKALMHYKRGEEIYEELGYVRGCENVLWSLGLFYYNVGDIAKSKEYQARCRESAEIHKNNLMLAYSCSLLGDIKKSEKDYDSAVECYNRAIERFTELGATRELHQLNLSKFEIFILFNDLSQAYGLVKKAKEIINKIKVPSSETIIRQRLVENIYNLTIQNPDFQRVNMTLNDLEQNESAQIDWELRLLIKKARANYFDKLSEFDKRDKIFKFYKR